ncbi:MAG: ribonuclease E [Gammaproteobacteria bacterium]|nr:ribonuclease E [Gammaproteobacteria bacterium]MCP5136980.1 ribonuclease E [Gammaproteobacteria bacterium]
MKRMLINATHQEELRVAIVDGQKLYDLDIETPSREQKKANIYKGRITRIEPSLEAAFVDYGAERHGFLPFKEVSRAYFRKEALEGNKRPTIKEALKEGQEIVVQVDKEERGNKGAALTSFISLAGRYLVLMPNNPRAGGVSRRIEGDDRAELREAMSELEIPDGMGVIVRTAGVGRSAEELQWDLNYLTQLWTAISEASDANKAPLLIYQESNVIIRALRDYLRNDIGEILVDNPEVYQQGVEFVQQVMPQYLNKLKLYEDTTPLFSRFQIESQIESAFRREVRLPSGGAIVIDPTEALVSIDINSARATKGGDIEETALNTNLEAADEIARQLRLRDMGGLVVIDFIDMSSNRSQRLVEDRIREALKLDRARVQVGRISRFGLLEMSRQRLRPSLGESANEMCPRCHGQGTIRGIESLALAVLRIVEEEAMKDHTARVVAQLPVEVASYLLNEKRDGIASIQHRQRVDITLVPNPHLDTPHYEIIRMRADDENQDTTSYRLITEPPTPELPSARAEAVAAHADVPAVRGVTPQAPAPTPTPTPTPEPTEIKPVNKEPEGGGFIRRMFSALLGKTAKKDEPEVVEDTKPKRNSRSRNKDGNRNRRSDNRDRDDSRNENNRDKSSRGGRNNRRGDKSNQARNDRPHNDRPQNDRNQNDRPQNDHPQKEPRNRRPNKPETEVVEEAVNIAMPVDGEAANDTNPATDGDAPRRSRRGRRGGRRRRGNRNNDVENNGNNNAVNDSTDADSDQNDTDTVASEAINPGEKPTRADLDMSPPATAVTAPESRDSESVEKDAARAAPTPESQADAAADESADTNTDTNAEAPAKSGRSRRGRRGGRRRNNKARAESEASDNRASENNDDAESEHQAAYEVDSFEDEDDIIIGKTNPALAAVVAVDSHAAPVEPTRSQPVAQTTPEISAEPESSMEAVTTSESPVPADVAMTAETASPAQEAAAPTPVSSPEAETAEAQPSAKVMPEPLPVPLPEPLPEPKPDQAPTPAHAVAEPATEVVDVAPAGGSTAASAAPETVSEPMMAEPTVDAAQEPTPTVEPAPEVEAIPDETSASDDETKAKTQQPG